MTEPVMFYFGPWERSGHHLVNEYGRTVYDKEKRQGLPWDEDSSENAIDCVLQPTCYKTLSGYPRYKTAIEGEALLHHKHGWTALSFWDSSVDKRGGCNSTYFAKGTFTFEEMVELARTRFAKRWNKMDFTVQLAKNEMTHAGTL